MSRKELNAFDKLILKWKMKIKKARINDNSDLKKKFPKLPKKNIESDKNREDQEITSKELFKIKNQYDLMKNQVDRIPNYIENIRILNREVEKLKEQVKTKEKLRRKAAGKAGGLQTKLNKNSKEIQELKKALNSIELESVKNDFKLDYYFVLYKDRAIPNAKSFRKLLSEKYNEEDEKLITKAYIKINTYQVKKYGQSLTDSSSIIKELKEVQNEK